MERKYTNRRYLDALQSRVLIFDGAMGTSLQAQNLSAEQFGGEQYNGCNDYLVISYPQAVEKVHRSFLEVGVDVIETNTFRANRLTMNEYGLAGRVGEINQAAASLARRLADEYSTPEQPRFVAGSIGPTGKLPSADDPELSNIPFNELVDVYRQQAASLARGGVDLIMIDRGGLEFEALDSLEGVITRFRPHLLVNLSGSGAGHPALDGWCREHEYGVVRRFEHPGSPRVLLEARRRD